MKKVVFRVISVLIISSFLFSAVACSNKQAASGGGSQTLSAGTEEPEETRDARFDGVDFGGRDFRVLTSADATDATNANDMIEGSGELNGDVVNDAVFNRNLTVKELLNVNLVFTQTNYTYTNADAEIRKLIMSASDDYDVIINDCRSLAALSDENMFVNIYNASNFDFSRSYWYASCMEDLQVVPGYMYLMAGDYFMDVIASCHCLFYNKNLIESYYGDPEYIYQLVLDGKWTYENMSKLIESCYLDVNGDGKANEGDRFGLTMYGSWGSAIPFIGSSGTKFIDRSSSTPVFCFNNERSVALLEALNKIFWGPGTLDTLSDTSDVSLGVRNLFANGLTVLVGLQRLGDLKRMRDIDSFEIGVVPYPKLYETDSYVTSIHDTTEMGVIPSTCTDADFVTAVIEVLSRETSTTVMPQYYETALKVKYITDSVSATMIDLIHDSFGSSFPLAYDSSLNGIMLHSFSDPLTAKSTDFASTYAKLEPTALANLQKMIDDILANNTAG